MAISSLVLFVLVLNFPADMRRGGNGKYRPLLSIQSSHAELAYDEFDFRELMTFAIQCSIFPRKTTSITLSFLSPENNLNHTVLHVE